MISSKRARGQALLELAIYGSLMLFCLGVLVQYGMRSNYQQYLQMTTFRRALSLAGNRSDNNATNQFSQGVNFTVIHDKSIPSPLDPYGVHDRYPYMASAGVVFSNKLHNTITASVYGDREYLPGEDTVINEGAGPGWLHGPDAGGDMNTQVGYTTAGWSYRTMDQLCGAGMTHRKKEIDYDGVPGNMIWWRWREGITCDTVDPDGEKFVAEGRMIDLDNDYVEETLIEKHQTCVTIENDDELGAPITVCNDAGYFILDPNSGEIDRTYGQLGTANLDGVNTVVIQPMIDPATGLEVRQGVQMDTQTKAQTVRGTQGGGLNTHSVRIETHEGIRNIFGANTTEVITRDVLLNDKTTNSELPAALPRADATSTLDQDEQHVWYTPF